MTEAKTIKLQSERTRMVLATWDKHKRQYDTSRCPVQQVEITVEAYVKDGAWVVAVTEGYVTGYESFYVDDVLQRPPTVGMHWCAGTPGRYDRLYTPQPQVEELLHLLRNLPAAQ